MGEEYGSDLCCETKFIAIFIRQALFYRNILF